MSQDRTKPQPSLPRPDFFSEVLRRARLADATVSRPARRTLAEMAPGFVRQPVLRIVPVSPDANEPCIFCERMSCDGMCNPAVPAPAHACLGSVA